MKTIEERAFDRYKSDQRLQKHKRMDASNYIDWANFGAKEAQRWIPIDEELPEKFQSWHYEKGRSQNYKYYEYVLCKTTNGKVFVCIRYEFLGHGVEWDCSGSVKQSIISWRPIDLK